MFFFFFSVKLGLVICKVLTKKKMETIKECVRASDNNTDVLNEFKCLELDKMHSWDTVGIGTCVLSHCNYSLRIVGCVRRNKKKNWGKNLKFSQK